MELKVPDESEFDFPPIYRLQALNLPEGVSSTDEALLQSTFRAEFERLLGGPRAVMWAHGVLESMAEGTEYIYDRDPDIHDDAEVVEIREPQGAQELSDMLLAARKAATAVAVAAVPAAAGVNFVYWGYPSVSSTTGAEL